MRRRTCFAPLHHLSSRRRIADTALICSRQLLPKRRSQRYLLGVQMARKTLGTRPGSAVQWILVGAEA